MTLASEKAKKKAKKAKIPVFDEEATRDWIEVSWERETPTPSTNIDDVESIAKKLFPTVLAAGGHTTISARDWWKMGCSGSA